MTEKKKPFYMQPVGLNEDIVEAGGYDLLAAFHLVADKLQALAVETMPSEARIRNWTGMHHHKVKRLYPLLTRFLLMAYPWLTHELPSSYSEVTQELLKGYPQVTPPSKQVSNPRGSNARKEENRIEEKREEPPLPPQGDEEGEGWDLSPEFMAALNLPREEVRETVKEPAIPDRDALDGQNPSPPLPPPPPSQPVDEVRAYVDRFVGRIGKRRMVVSSDYGNWDHILRKLANDGTPLDVLDKVHERALADSFWGVNGLHCLTNAAKFEAKLGKLIERFATEPPHPVLHKLQQHPFWIDTQTGAVFFPSDFVVADKDSIHSPVMPHVLLTLDCLSWHLRPCPLAEMTQEVVDENLASPHCRHSLQEILDHGNRQAS